MRRIALVFVAVFLALFLGSHVGAQSAAPVIFQVSTITALMNGEYDGLTTFAELMQHGDFGLGTLDGLDGEMIGIGGRFYQIRSDGSVHAISDSATTPFSVVAFFVPAGSTELAESPTLKQLLETLDSRLIDQGIIHAVRIEGHFASIKVRSVPRQSKPYRGLEEVIKEQTIFELSAVKGTMVGFRFPSSIGCVNVSGYHFHFLTEDRRAGGHVLDCNLREGRLEWAAISDLRVVLSRPVEQRSR